MRTAVSLPKRLWVQRRRQQPQKVGTETTFCSVQILADHWPREGEVRPGWIDHAGNSVTEQAGARRRRIMPGTASHQLMHLE
eukprot:6187128-Pleurochrysis_carterae.AAC.3